MSVTPQDVFAERMHGSLGWIMMFRQISLLKKIKKIKCRGAAVDEDKTGDSEDGRAHHSGRAIAEALNSTISSSGLPPPLLRPHADPYFSVPRFSPPFPACFVVSVVVLIQHDVGVKRSRFDDGQLTNRTVYVPSSHANDFAAVFAKSKSSWEVKSGAQMRL